MLLDCPLRTRTILEPTTTHEGIAKRDDMFLLARKMLWYRTGSRYRDLHFLGARFGDKFALGVVPRLCLRGRLHLGGSVSPGACQTVLFQNLQDDVDRILFASLGF